MRRQAECQMVEQGRLAGTRIPQEDEVTVVSHRLQCPQRTVRVAFSQLTCTPLLFVPLSAGDYSGSAQVDVDAGKVEVLLIPGGVTGAHIYTPEREVTV